MYYHYYMNYVGLQTVLNIILCMYVPFYTQHHIMVMYYYQLNTNVAWKATTAECADFTVHVSPTAHVGRFVHDFMRFTICALCVGEQRQHTTTGHRRASLMNSD